MQESKHRLQGNRDPQQRAPGPHLGVLLQELRERERRGALLPHAQRQRRHAALQQEAGVRVQGTPVHHHVARHLRRAPFLIPFYPFLLLKHCQPEKCRGIPAP